TLSDASLAVGGFTTIGLSSIEVANLTGGASANTFTVSGWTGSGTITGGGGADTISAIKDADFTLSDTALSASDGMNLALLGIGTANLTGGASASAFNVSSWTGTANLDGAAGDDVFNIATSGSGTVNVTGGLHTVGD